MSSWGCAHFIRSSPGFRCSSPLATQVGLVIRRRFVCSIRPGIYIFAAVGDPGRFVDFRAGRPFHSPWDLHIRRRWRRGIRGPTLIRANCHQNADDRKDRKVQRVSSLSRNRRSDLVRQSPGLFVVVVIFVTIFITIFFDPFPFLINFSFIPTIIM